VFQLEGLVTDPVPLVYFSELQLDEEGLGSFIKPAQTFVWKSEWVNASTVARSLV